MIILVIVLNGGMKEAPQHQHKKSTKYGTHMSQHKHCDVHECTRPFRAPKAGALGRPGLLSRHACFRGPREANHLAPRSARTLPRANTGPAVAAAHSLPSAELSTRKAAATATFTGLECRGRHASAALSFLLHPLQRPRAARKKIVKKGSGGGRSSPIGWACGEGERTWPRQCGHRGRDAAILREDFDRLSCERDT